MTNEGIGINRDTSTICLREYVFIHFFPVKLISALTNKTNTMVKLTSIAAGVAARCRVNLVELGVYVSDIRAHLAQYYLFQAAHPTETYPVEIAEAVFNYGDFTTMLTGIPAEQVTRVITGVPWYSTRLRPAISSALSKDGIYTAIPK
ncbi:CBM_collapsed_G0056410.mRNA.1.CDS.1 [Saccharomyces cerevisiae]|nr:CBM_collapsed_G0056410.mRNA.1.CDS.1 [Saccharomyces cerevisiae]